VQTHSRSQSAVQPRDEGGAYSASINDQPGKDVPAAAYFPLIHLSHAWFPIVSEMRLRPKFATTSVNLVLQLTNVYSSLISIAGFQCNRQHLEHCK
jgi:hypothetical protein